METTRFLSTSALALILGLGGMLPQSLRASGERVKLKTAVDRPLLAESGDGGRVILRIGLEGCLPPRGADRAPLNLAVVLDRSGSMSGAKLEQAKQAAAWLVEHLEDGDVLSLVAYETEVQVLVAAARLGGRREAFRRAIDRLETGGSTALHGGVEEGARQLREFLDRERINRVLLLSDGLANVGPKDNASIAALGTRLAREGMSVTTLGLGGDYNETLMTALAEASDANYYHIADVETLPEIFAKELGELQSIVARELEIEIRFSEGVRPLRILGRPGELRPGKEQVAFATLSGGQSREIFLECELGPEALGRVTEIARVGLSYEDAASRDRISREATPVVVGYSDNADLVARSVDRAIVAEAAIYENAEATEAALALADRGDAEGSRRQIDSQISKLTAVQAAAPAAQQAEIGRELEEIVRTRRELDSSGISGEQRKRLSNRAWSLRNSKAK